MGDDVISGGPRKELDRELEDYHLKLIKLSELFNESLDVYSNAMRASLGTVESYFDESGLIRTHQDAKRRAVAKV